MTFDHHQLVNQTARCKTIQNPEKAKQNRVKVCEAEGGLESLRHLSNNGV